MRILHYPWFLSSNINTVSECKIYLKQLLILLFIIFVCFADDVVEAYNLIKDLEPTTPQVTT